MDGISGIIVYYDDNTIQVIKTIPITIVYGETEYRDIYSKIIDTSLTSEIEIRNKNPIRIDIINIQKIGKNSFRNTIFLEKVCLPEGLTQIEEKAFENCFNLKFINKPKSLSLISSTAFLNTPIEKDFI